MPKPARSKKWIFFLIGAIPFVLMVALIGPHMCEQKSIELFNIGGEPKEVHLVQTDGLLGVIIGEDVQHNHGGDALYAMKYSVFHLADGRRVSMITTDHSTRCFGMAADLLWCVDEELGLHARDPVSLQPSWDQSAFATDKPGPRGTVRKRHGDFDFEQVSGRILIKTDQGYYHFFDTRTRKLTEAPNDASVSNPHYSVTSTHVKLSNGERVNLDGRERKHLIHKEKPSQDSYLKGEFLQDRISLKVVEAPGSEPNLFIAHWTRLDKSDRERGLLLSRVDLLGNERWRVEVEKLLSPPDEEDASRDLKFTFITAQGMLLVFEIENRGKLLMFEPDSGKLRWKVEL